MAACKFDLESSQIQWMNSGAFARALIHLHVQRNKSYYLKWKHRNVEKVKLIKVVETLVEWVNITETSRSKDWDKQKKQNNFQPLKKAGSR